MAPSYSAACLLLSAALVLHCCSGSLAAPPTPNITHSANRCLWRGQCGPSDNGFYNCFYNGPPVNVTPGSDLQKNLKSMCPQYANGAVCCDNTQVTTLITQLSPSLQLLGGCPACIKNFIDNFCATTCDPNMAQYMKGDLEYNSKLEKWQVQSATVYLSEQYGNDLFTSCKNVQNPQDNSGKVVDLMCNGVSPCTPTAWFAYLGTGNPYIPFPMKYIFVDNVTHFSNGIVPKTKKLIPCNTTNPDYQCSCTDCGTPDVCPPPPTPLKNTFPTKLIMLTVGSVGAGIVLLVFGAALIAGIIQVLLKPKGYTRIGSRSPKPNTYGTMPEDDNESPTNSIGSINDDEIIDDTQESTRCCCYSYFRIGALFKRFLKKIFYLWGKFATRYWPLVIIFGVVIVGGLSSGVYRFQVVTNTVELWSAPDSRARVEKNYFDENFNPFYRTEMIIIKPLNQSAFFQALDPPAWFGPALQWNVLNETFYLQQYLLDMKVPFLLSNGTLINITLQDICFQPLSPGNKNCTVSSVINYFQNNYDTMTAKSLFTQDPLYPEHLYYCARDPTSLLQTYSDETTTAPCLASFGGPVDPNVAFGGFNYNTTTKQYEYQNATALIITFTVNNHVNEEDNAKAEAWEKAFLDYVKNYNGTTFNISYLAERSTVDELERESQTDELTVVISYLFMFAYITLFLGHIRSVATVLIDMKLVVGLVGVLLVLGAVLASVGLLSYIGVPGSLIILEVVPFLVLAVGVDNLFIIIHSYERQAKKFATLFEGDLSKIPVDELIGRAIGEVAPSLLLTSMSETAAFLLGGISTMPAVRSFSFYAGVAVFFNFLLQITIFVAVVALDARRQLANRFDVLVCLKLKGKFNPNAGVDILHFLMKWFAKFILYPLVRPFVLLLFGTTTVVSLVFLFRLDIGLDQTLAFPKDSYLIPYFNDMHTYLRAGSPVYFVIKHDSNVDYSQQEIQNKICAQAGCKMDSLGTQVTVYAKEPNMTRIAEPGMLWVDTYFQWISPINNCCGLINGTEKEYCLNPGKGNCTKCLQHPLKGNRPNPADFKKHIKQFLTANPDVACPSGGHAAFASGVKLDETQKNVLTSYVMTYHTVLKTSQEYVDAIFWARRLSDNITTSLNLTVFPYSVFYVFYEQYLHTVHDMALNLGVSIGAVFLVTVLTMGLNVWAAFIIMLSVVMIIIHMLGCMALAGISANAVSLVNLVMTVGISVEFCSHIVRWFASCSFPTRTLRAYSALSKMGASVVSGITVTKFLGVFVLLFAKSQLFEIYYFRMYMFMLLWGALIGLVFLPVLLSYVGPPYCPVGNIPSPYDNSYIPPKQSNSSNSTTNFNPQKAPVPPPTSPHTQQYSSQYPDLPTIDDVEGRLNSNQQKYPAPTYPGQNQFQQRGVPYNYNAASETTQLLN